MNIAERKYYAFGKEALAFALAITEVCHYLLLAEPFTLINDQKALFYALDEKDVHCFLL